MLTAPGVVLLVLGHKLLGVGLLALVAVPAWWRVTTHELDRVRSGLGPGESVRLPDGTITPVQAARLEGFDSFVGDLSSGDGGGGSGGGS